MLGIHALSRRFLASSRNATVNVSTLFCQEEAQPEDVPAWVRNFVQRLAHEPSDRDDPDRDARGTASLCLARNVFELVNLIEHAMILSRGRMLEYLSTS